MNILSYFFFLQVAPLVTLQSGPVYWQGGKNGSLTCHVSGYPKPKVTWSKSPGELSVQRMMTSDKRLSLMNVQKSDSGYYTCRVTNHLGTRVATVLVVVQLAPQFIVKPPSVMTVPIGQTVNVDCSFEGDPQPIVTWRRDGGPLPLGRSETRDGSLIIRRIEARDSGKYICSGTSHALLKGVAAAVQLSVRGRCLNSP